MRKFMALVDLAGRALLGMTFAWWGGLKLVESLGIAGRPEGGGWTIYMEAFGVPGWLLPLVILTELGGGLALIAGWKTRHVAVALAGFCVLANLFFHTRWHLPPPAGNFNWAIFIKNFAVAGGLLAIAGRGAGVWSLDARRESAAR
jgi:putative oxidoreductase